MFPQPDVALPVKIDSVRLPQSLLWRQDVLYKLSLLVQHVNTVVFVISYEDVAHLVCTHVYWSKPTVTLSCVFISQCAIRSYSHQFPFAVQMRFLLITYVNVPIHLVHSYIHWISELDMVQSLPDLAFSAVHNNFSVFYGMPQLCRCCVSSISPRAPHWS